MWYIVMQTESSIHVILLTSSMNKCKKEFQRLESEVEEQEGEERYTFYYYGFCPKGVVRGCHQK